MLFKTDVWYESTYAGNFKTHILITNEYRDWCHDMKLRENDLFKNGFWIPEARLQFLIS